MDRHAPALLRFLRHDGLDPDQAEDVAQEALVAAWRHAGTFAGQEARPWLLAIARNAARRHLRRRAGEPRAHLPLDELAEGAGWGAEDADRVLAHLAARERVEHALAELTPEEREILVLRDMEGYRGAEAARVLGLTLAAQKSRLHRARLAFMAALRRNDDHEG